LPVLKENQKFYVRWDNTEKNDNYLALWACPHIISTTNSDAHRCNFNIDNIELISPDGGITTSLPSTFIWSNIRTGIFYELNLADVSDVDPWWWTSPLPYADRYTLAGLPDGFSPNEQYGWWVRVYGVNGYCYRPGYLARENMIRSKKVATIRPTSDYGQIGWQRQQQQI